MDMQELQFRLMDTLLRGASQKTRNPEAFKLLAGVFLKDMVHAAGGRTGKDWEPQIYFTYALCRDDEVLAVALPRLVSEEGGMTPLPSRRLSVLQAAGLPLFSNFFTRQEEDGETALRLNSQECPGPSGWRLPTVRVPPELIGLLCKKGMVSDDRSPDYPSPIPTGYGSLLGLCEARWYGRDSAGHLHPCAGLRCSAAGWVNRVRLGEHPWGDGPDWVPLSLDARLERMQAGRSGSPGHCMSAFLRLEAMPADRLMLTCLPQKYVEDNRADLEQFYPPGVTFGQTARNAARLLCSASEEDRIQAAAILLDLGSLFYCDYKRRTTKGEYQKAEAAHETKPADRSLSARLAWAGISEYSSPYLPLAGDHLDDVFQGLGRLIGSDAPARAFHQKMPLWLQEKIDGQWDGSLDSLIFQLLEIRSEVLKTNPIEGSDDGEEIIWVLCRLLAEPFCLLEEIRRLEKTYSALLEEVRAQNEILKKELERMNFDGSAS